MQDHRKLGRELELFDTDPLIGAGLPYWLPAGAAIRHALEEYIYDAERKAGYQHVHSPVLGKRELYEISGHWDHYRDGMYPPMTVRQKQGGAEEVVLRPSLCPHHALIFRSRSRSYRELPLRMAELGGQYRSELSGVLGGLTRVRSIQLNDGHIFCTLDQVADEVAASLAMIQKAYRDMGIEPARYRLSLASKGAKYVGSQEIWDQATEILKKALADAGLAYEAEEGEAAFYGPKIDIQIEDCSEREASLSTIQVDFYQPERFNLSYIGPDGGKHRPVMVHRSVIGGLERLVAHLTEVRGGAFPAWYAPTQLAVLPVGGGGGGEEVAWAAEVERRALEVGLRAEVVASDDTLGARIRAKRLVPYLGIVGAREAAAGEVSLRLRDGRQLPSVSAEDALAGILARVRSRSHQLWADA
jgi:threonyl-tRNA synthetase